MGNSITADSHPLVIDRLGEMGGAGHPATRPGTSTMRGTPLGGEDPRLNLKAWRFSGRYKVSCEGIDFLKERFTLDDSSTYLVMVLRKAARDESADASVESLSADTSTSASSLYNTLPPTLTSVFTPRGLKFPFSSFNNEAGYQKTIYIFYGKRASALAKAKALKHGLDLEKVLEQGGAGPSLIAAGDPCELVDKQIVTAAAGSPSTSTTPAASAAAIHILGTLGPPPQAAAAAAAASSAASSGAATPQAAPVAAAAKAAPPIPGFKPAFSLNLSSLPRGGAAGGAGAGGGSGGLRMPASGDPDSNRTLSASTTTSPPSSAHDTAALSSTGPRAGGRSSDERERFAAPAAAAAPVPTPPPVLDFGGLGASSAVPALSELVVPKVEVGLLPVEPSRSPPSPPNDSFASAATQPVATAMPKLGFALKLPARTAHVEADVEAEAAESHDTETSSCASSASDTEDASSDEKTEPKDPSPAWGGGGGGGGG
eukprot:Rhum_TRINITY_DN14805_c9_g2::Rhum_TRINITY_DN14805_c9_g2_i1::g.121463::m.121463